MGRPRKIERPRNFSVRMSAEELDELRSIRALVSEGNRLRISCGDLCRVGLMHVFGMTKKAILEEVEKLNGRS